MSIEQNSNPANIRRKNEDIVISIGIRDGDGRIVFLSHTQSHTQIENPQINNTIPCPNTEILFSEKEPPSLHLPTVSHSKEYTVKEDKVIDIGFLDEDGNIIRLSNNQS
ncbi:MAG: hypothetical protein KatS3mg089_0577 [Patescibacteria group bacterium]|nr:MAG: hypothetical protein KatS3mg089_0577 [Patescibacteria group bacterium]